MACRYRITSLAIVVVNGMIYLLRYVSISESYIYISVRQLYTENSHHACMFAHIKTPLMCKSYDFEVEWLMLLGLFISIQ